MGMFAELARKVGSEIEKLRNKAPENGVNSPEVSSEASGIEEAVTTPRKATASSIYRCAPAVAQLSLPPEVREIQEDMERDYNRSVETLKFYDKLPNPSDPSKLISAPLLQEDPEKPGKYYYVADYDGRNEMITDPADATKRIPNPDAVNFVGRKFTMPTCTEVLSWLTVDQARLYNEMKSQGLEPKLQLSPIAMNIRTMGRRIDAKRAELGINKNDTFVWDGIKDNELVYEADKFEAIEGGRKLKITGGKSKSQWINEHNGWTVDIVATKEDIDADSDKKSESGVEFTSAEKMEKYMADSRRRGYRGLGYETYLTAQMDALRRGKPLEKLYNTALPESSLNIKDLIALGYWAGDRVLLSGSYADDQDGGFRFRRSVRVRRLEI